MSKEAIISQDRAFDLFDAIKCRRAVQKHLALVTKYGVTKPLLAEFDTVIASAKADDKAYGRVSLAGPRGAFKERLGNYFAIADLYARGPNVVDTEALQALKLDHRDLSNDSDLDGVLNGLAKSLDHYANELASVGFTKTMRDALLKTGADFHEAYTARPMVSGENKVKTDARDALFGNLRRLTNWFRRAGRTALRNDKARTDFDRVKLKAKKAAKRASPAAKASSTAQGDTSPAKTG